MLLAQSLILLGLLFTIPLYDLRGVALIGLGVGLLVSQLGNVESLASCRSGSGSRFRRA